MATTETSTRAASEQPPPHHVTFEESPPSRPHSSRPRPKHLQPLATGQVMPKQRRMSGPYLRYLVTAGLHPSSAISQGSDGKSPVSPGSAVSQTSLATPSLQQVRKYHLENGLQTAFQSKSPSSPQAPPSTPAYNLRRSSRRGSAVSPATALSNHFNKLSATSPVVGRSYRQRSIVDDNRDTLLSGVPRGELSRLESVVSGTSSRASPNASRRASEMVPVLLKKPPKERLREWGSVYLGNSQQADVFVHAVPILRRGSEERDATAALSRRGSIVSTRSDIGDGSLRGIHEVETDPDHVIFRARVFPILKDRNPFTMQRKFAKIELRNMALSALKGDAAKSSAASENVETPKPEEKEGENEEEKDKEGDSKMLDVDDGVSPKGRSKSTPTPKPSALHSPSPSSPAPRRLPHFDSRRTVMPIHMDYALRYLPALGLLMLSGHIRKGDQIDLPVPHPEAWAEAIAYVYTGLGQPGVKARENVEYLGGVVDVSGDGKDEATKDGEKDGESET